MVKRGFIAAVGGAAIVIAGLSGCSSDDKSDSDSTTTSSTAATTTTVETDTTTVTAEAGPGEAKVTIDGQAQEISGTVACSAMGGNFNIAIGDAPSGITVVISEGDEPTVQSVALGNVGGVSLGYQQGTGQGDAKAEKDGNTYKVSGTATGVDMANPVQQVTKPFEIEVSCP
ncbi:Lipoprotein LpqH [Mycolicibacterium hassiacum DSM 44199]|nr:hypothetical protein [Mycolicibacterium hassiacum DSM 44199]VCT92249.1 Lipoprotein LpqH [Mycolicibacterium hassiacum DSM 44199]